MAKVWLNVNEQLSSLQGLRLVDIAGQFQAATTGQVLGSILEGTEQLLVRVDTQGAEQAEPGQVNDLLLTARGDAPGLPFSAIGEVSVEPTQAWLLVEMGNA